MNAWRLWLFCFVRSALANDFVSNDFSICQISFLPNGFDLQ